MVVRGRAFAAAGSMYNVRLIQTVRLTSKRNMCRQCIQGLWSHFDLDFAEAHRNWISPEPCTQDPTRQENGMNKQFGSLPCGHDSINTNCGSEVRIWYNNKSEHVSILNAIVKKSTSVSDFCPCKLPNITTKYTYCPGIIFLWNELHSLGKAFSYYVLFVCYWPLVSLEICKNNTETLEAIRANRSQSRGKCQSDTTILAEDPRHFAGILLSRRRVNRDWQVVMVIWGCVMTGSTIPISQPQRTSPTDSPVSCSNIWP